MARGKSKTTVGVEKGKKVALGYFFDKIDPLLEIILPAGKTLLLQRIGV